MCPWTCEAGKWGYIVYKHVLFPQRCTANIPTPVWTRVKKTQVEHGGAQNSSDPLRIFITWSGSWLVRYFMKVSLVNSYVICCAGNLTAANMAKNPGTRRISWFRPYRTLGYHCGSMESQDIQFIFACMGICFEEPYNTTK